MTQMSDPPLTQIPARKALGQHFLFDPDILSRTALAAGPVEGRTILEVGPGPGGLTRALLDAGVKKLVAVEADRRFAEVLNSWPEAQTGRLDVLHTDARSVDWARLDAIRQATEPVKIIANLPYNVGTPLLIDWLKAGAWRAEMALMFQKEVALRACASPGTAHYGRLAVLSAAVCTAQIAFTLPPGAFKPPPKVDSAVAVFHPLPEAECFEHLSALEAVTQAGFGQRRKMLRVSLKRLATQANLASVEWLAQAGIDPTARAETLSQAQFRALATLYHEAIR